MMIASYLLSEEHFAANDPDLDVLVEAKKRLKREQIMD